MTIELYMVKKKTINYIIMKTKVKLKVRSETNILIRLVRELLQKAKVAFFSHYSRSANGVVHTLASVAAGLLNQSVDFSLPLLCGERVLLY